MSEYLLILGFCMAVHKCDHFCFAKSFKGLYDSILGEK